MGSVMHSASDDLLTSVDRATRLIEQLLALARADAEAGPQPAHAWVSLDELVRGQVREHAALAERRGLRLIARVEAAVTWGAPPLLAVLLRNLIDNALRYTPAGGEVVVTARHEGDTAELAVQDNGPGIAAAERERIFERFYRIVGSAEPGSGLGLSIVHGIMQACDGAVQAVITIFGGIDFGQYTIEGNN